MTDPIPTDFWGIVMPTWLGAVGSIGASIVAVVAIYMSRSARSGVENIGSGLNVQSETRATWESLVDLARSDPAEEGTEEKSTSAETAGAGVEMSLFGPRVRWRLVYITKNQYGLVNDSPARAKVSAVRNISDGHRDALMVHTEPPVDIDPGSQLLFSVHKSFASPAVTAVEVVWTEGRNGRQRTAVFYV